VPSSPELQERKRTKLADLTTALAEALRRRGATDATAKLLAQIGIAIFQAAFERWVDRESDAAFSACIREATAEVESGLSSLPA
jgi:hypothetical protein